MMNSHRDFIASLESEHGNWKELILWDGVRSGLTLLLTLFPPKKLFVYLRGGVTGRERDRHKDKEIFDPLVHVPNGLNS